MIVMTENKAPLKLPTGVDWNGAEEAFVAFMTAVFNNCPNTRQSCGGLPKNCSLCAILCDQQALNRMVYIHEIRKHIGEWREVDRINFTVVKLDHRPESPSEENIW